MKLTDKYPSKAAWLAQGKCKQACGRPVRWSGSPWCVECGKRNAENERLRIARIRGEKNLSTPLQMWNPFVDETPADLNNLPPQYRTVTKLVTINERKNKQDYFRNQIALKMFSFCVITGFDLVDVCEAVHIIPVKPHHGPDKPGNCLLMVVSMHRAFDRFMFTIRPDGLIVVAPKYRNSSLGAYHLKKLLVPLREDHREYLEWHNTIFLSVRGKEFHEN